MKKHIPDILIEVKEYNGSGYQPLVDFQAWRVALMNYTPSLVPEQINAMQRHDQTDEVFVLLAGRCILFLGEGKDTVNQIYAQDLLPFRLYNVKRCAWHTHTFNREARVLIVENADTNEQNSPFLPLNSEQRRQIIALARQAWPHETNNS